jgi:hypothetical protein
MSVYGQIFSTSGETAAIERTERRYAWLRRRLRGREDLLGIFPEPWRVAQRICLAFAAQTRAQLAEILAARVRSRRRAARGARPRGRAGRTPTGRRAAQAGELGGSVEALLVAVKATNDFEAEMAERFGGGAAAAAAVRWPPPGRAGLRLRSPSPPHASFVCVVPQAPPPVSRRSRAAAGPRQRRRSLHRPCLDPAHARLTRSESQRRAAAPRTRAAVTTTPARPAACGSATSGCSRRASARMTRRAPPRPPPARRSRPTPPRAPLSRAPSPPPLRRTSGARPPPARARSLMFTEPRARPRPCPGPTARASAAPGLPGGEGKKRPPRACSVYVAAEERALMELAGGLAAGETWRPMEDAAQTHVLHSASQLFGAIKKSLQRCARFVSRGEAMLRLMASFQARRRVACLRADFMPTPHSQGGLRCRARLTDKESAPAACPADSRAATGAVEYSAAGRRARADPASRAQRVLRFYAGKLVARLPKTAAGGTTGAAAAGTTDWHIRLADDDVPVACALIATAEYCHEMVGALARSAAKMLDPPLGAQARPRPPPPVRRRPLSSGGRGARGAARARAGQRGGGGGRVPGRCDGVPIGAGAGHGDAPGRRAGRDDARALGVAGGGAPLPRRPARRAGPGVRSTIAGNPRGPLGVRERGAARAQVGDQSDFVTAFSRVLSPLHFRYFCDKLAASFCPRFYENIFRRARGSRARPPAHWPRRVLTSGRSRVRGASAPLSAAAARAGTARGAQRHHSARPRVLAAACCEQARRQPASMPLHQKQGGASR